MTAAASVDLATIAQNLGCAQQSEIAGKICEHINSIYGSQVLSVYEAFINEEDFDEETIVDDFNEALEESEILSGMASLNWDDAQLADFYGTLRVFLTIDADESTVRMVLPKDMQWPEVTEAEVDRAYVAFNDLCFQRLMRESDEGLLRVFHYGRLNGINLLPMVYDVYHRCRIEIKMGSRNAQHVFDGASMDPNFFCVHSPYFRELKNTLKFSENTGPVKDIEDGLNSFGSRLLPQFVINRAMDVIFDDVQEYIDYACVIGQVLNELVPTKSKLRPTQLDLVIVPAKRGQDSSYGNYGDEEDDSASASEDEDKSDEDDDGDGYNNNHQHDRNATQSLKVLLDAYDLSTIEVAQDTIDPSPSAFVASKNRLKNLIHAKLKNTSHRRITVVIDKRFASPENQLLVYCTPAKFSVIPSAFEIENLIYAAGNYLVPKLVQKEHWFGGKNDSIKIRQQSIPIWTLSYELLPDGRNRLQWFWNGQGIRVRPHLFLTLWPHCFKDQKRDTFAKVTRAHIEAKFGLDCADELYDQWYEVLKPR